MDPLMLNRSQCALPCTVLHVHLSSFLSSAFIGQIPHQKSPRKHYEGADEQVVALAVKTPKATFQSQFWKSSLVLFLYNSLFIRGA